MRIKRLSYYRERIFRYLYRQSDQPFIQIGFDGKGRMESDNFNECLDPNAYYNFYANTIVFNRLGAYIKSEEDAISVLLHEGEHWAQFLLVTRLQANGIVLKYADEKDKGVRPFLERINPYQSEFGNCDMTEKEAEEMLFRLYGLKPNDALPCNCGKSMHVRRLRILLQEFEDDIHANYLGDEPVVSEILLNRFYFVCPTCRNKISIDLTGRHDYSDIKVEIQEPINSK